MPYSVPQPALARREPEKRATERQSNRERAVEKYVYKHAHLARDHQFSMPTTAYFEILFPFTIPGPSTAPGLQVSRSAAAAGPALIVITMQQR